MPNQCLKCRAGFKKWLFMCVCGTFCRVNLVVKDFYLILAFGNITESIMAFYHDITTTDIATTLVGAVGVVITVIAVGTGIGTGTTPVGVGVHICR